MDLFIIQSKIEFQTLNVYQKILIPKLKFEYSLSAKLSLNEVFTNDSLPVVTVCTLLSSISSFHKKL